MSVADPRGTRVCSGTATLGNSFGMHSCIGTQRLFKAAVYWSFTFMAVPAAGAVGRKHYRTAAVCFSSALLTVRGV